MDRLWRSDYVALAKFLVPLAFTDIAVDIGEQFLNRSIANAANVVNTLAAFGLAYVIIKFFVGILEEVKQVGVVLVHDRPGFHKFLVCVFVMGMVVFFLSIIIAKTHLGVWLFEDLHGVPCSVGRLTRQAILYLSAYPLLHAISWLHGGVLLQFRHSVLVGVASLSDIVAQIVSVGILLWTPVICKAPIAVPILAAYCGVLTRTSVILTAFYCKVYFKLSKNVKQPVSVWKLVTFVSPLMFVLAVQRSTRPTVNLLAAHYSPTKYDAAQTIAVLTAAYPLGHIVYGWLNQVRPISPAFQKKSVSGERRLVSGRKIAFFIVGALVVSATVSFSLLWIPGVSVAVLEKVIGVPREIALLSVDPLRVFAFNCFTVAVRASLTGWLTLHEQTKFVTPSGFLRVASVLATFFILRALGMSGPLLAVLALFSGFFSEMVTMTVVASSYAIWRRHKHKMAKAPDPAADLAGEDADNIELLQLRSTNDGVAEEEEGETLFQVPSEGLGDEGGGEPEEASDV